MSEQSKTPLYEVGTLEQYEEGFHAFYRTLNKDKALKVLEVAKDCQARYIEWDGQDSSFYNYLAENEKINNELQQLTGNDFKISGYQSELYTIELREVTLDD